MGAPAGDATAGAAIFASLATAAPAGGWCAIVGKAPGSPLDVTDVERIASYVRAALMRDPRLGIGLNVPGLNVIYMTMIESTVGGVRNALTKWVAEGRTCDSIPNNLTEVPEIAQSVPGGQGAGPLVGGILNAVIDWTGLGDVFVKGVVLVGIVVLVVIAIRRVLQ